MRFTPEILSTFNLKFSKLAGEYNSQGKKIISLGLGEPHLATPNKIVKSTIDAIKNGSTKYSNPSGLYELRKHLSDKLYKENKILTNPEKIIVTAGSKQACAFSLMALLEPGDEVICFTPSYISYIPQIKIAEPRCKIRSISLNKNDFKINFKTLKKNINKKTKVILINSPNNPTGTMFSKKDIIKISNLIKNRNIFLISDEVYEKLSFGKMPHFSPGSIKEISEKVITINGFSKAFAMTGWRLGYLNASKEIINKISKINQHLNTNTNTFIQKGVLNAYNLNKKFIIKFNKDLKIKSDYLNSILNKKYKCNLIIPNGGFFAFLNISTTKLSSDEFSYQFLKLCKVAVTPGVIFGKDWNQYIRISMSTNIRDFKKGINLLGLFFNETK